MSNQETSISKDRLSRPLTIIWYGLLVWIDLQSTIMIFDEITDPMVRFYVMLKTMLILAFFLIVIQATRE